MAESGQKQQWAVVQSEYWPGEAPSRTLFGSFAIFDTKEEAVAFIEKVIREEWTTEVEMPTEEDEYHQEPLADHRGYQSDEDSMKWSDVCYAEDGTEAWADGGASSTKYIKAVPMRPKGERTSTC